MSEMKITIALIDRQQLFREGVKKVLEAESSFNVLVSSDDYSAIKSLLPIQNIDVILIDVSILIENQESISKDIILNSKAKIIVMATEGEKTFVTEAIKLGAYGYLLKDMDIYSFVDAIKTVETGVAYIHPQATHELVEEYRNLTLTEGNEVSAKLNSPPDLYTKREGEVLQLLTDGKSNRHIADLLNISEKTVKNHVSSLFKKMNVHDRTQAVVMAIRNNWVNYK
ncbi:response regulator transcription factor [Pseudogracilibacillus sp. SE30717A]|uniref:response regulator transcription factor n=1 Tax=Pseudogracilibacillus sp. SE30717A TaxID=3098293 RepID=UPI00300E67B7